MFLRDDVPAHYPTSRPSKITSDPISVTQPEKQNLEKGRISSSSQIVANSAELGRSELLSRRQNQRTPLDELQSPSPRGGRSSGRASEGSRTCSDSTLSSGKSFPCLLLSVSPFLLLQGKTGSLGPDCSILARAFIRRRL